MEVKVLKDSYYGKHRKVTVQVRCTEGYVYMIKHHLLGKLVYCTRTKSNDVCVITGSYAILLSIANERTVGSNPRIVNMFLDELFRALTDSEPVKRAVHAPFVSDLRINEVFKSENLEEELKKVVGLSVYQCFYNIHSESEDVVLEKLKKVVTSRMVTAFNHCGIVYNEVDGYVSPHVFMSELTNYGV